MTFCKTQKRISGCENCLFGQACEKSTCQSVEDYPNIGEGFFESIADDISEINEQKKKQNRA